jgi:hypothetical protein
MEYLASRRVSLLVLWCFVWWQWKWPQTFCILQVVTCASVIIMSQISQHSHKHSCRLGVHTAVLLKIHVLWDVVHHVRGQYPEDWYPVVLRNTGKYLRSGMASHPSGLESLLSSLFISGIPGFESWSRDQLCWLFLFSLFPPTEMSTRNISWGVKAAGA